MSDIPLQGHVPTSEDNGISQLHALIVPHTSPEVLKLLITILEPTSLRDGFLEYREHLKLRVDVERLGCRFREIVLVNPAVGMPQSHLSDPSRLLLYGTAYCGSRAGPQASTVARRLCDPAAFPLPPNIEGSIKVLMAFDDFNTRFSSQFATFNIPARYRRPSSGQSFRCDHESLMISFALKDCLGNDVTTFRVGTPLKARKHQSGQPPQAVQPNYSVLPHATPDFGSTETLPQIVDIIPQFGPHFTRQRVWVKVRNLPRGNGLHYFIGFGEAGTVSTSFMCEEGDQIQILECATPVTSTPCPVIPSLMQGGNPPIPIGSSDVEYAFY